MAVREVIVSDISGEDVPDDQRTRLVINGHPSLTTAVELDVSTAEAAKLQSSNLDLVTITVYEPNTLPRRVLVEASTFAKLFREDVEQVLARARRSAGAETSAPRRSRTASSARSGNRTDYTAMENIGVLHRGKVTEAEAELVRNNLDKANTNRKREGQPEIDINDAKEKKRYGF